MPKVVEIPDDEYARIAAVIEAAAPDGVERNAHKLRHLYGRELMPSRRAWIETFIQIEHKSTGQLIPFTFNRVQRQIEMWRLRCKRAGLPQRAVILKSRHHGVSTQFVAYGLEEVLRDEGKALYRAGIVAQEDDTAKELLENGKFMRNQLPWALPTKYDNRSALWFDRPINGYVDILSAKTQHKGRGKHYRFLHMTEVAFWPDPEKTFVALSQTVPHADPNTLLTIETTANGAGGWFYEFFWDAWHGKNEFDAMFFPWFWDPELRRPVKEPEAILETLDDEEKELIRKFSLDVTQLAWRRWAVSNLCGGSIDLFHQEYPSTPREAFITSGRPVFPIGLMDRAREGIAEPLWEGMVAVRGKKPFGVDYELIKQANGPLKIWSVPQDGVSYCMASDSAEGVGQDYSAVEVLEVQSGCQVAEYADNHINPIAFGDVCVAIAQHFNRAHWLPEANPPGNATMQVGLDLGYERILRRQIFGRAGKVIDLKWGWQTKEDSKRLMVKEIVQGLAEEHLSIVSADLLGELTAYQVTEEGRVPRYEAPKGAHDDLVISWGIARMARRILFEQAIEEPEPEAPETLSQRHWREFEESLGQDPEEEEEEYGW